MRIKCENGLPYLNNEVLRIMDNID